MKLTNTRLGSWNGIAPGATVEVPEKESKEYLDAGFTVSTEGKEEINGVIDTEAIDTAKFEAKKIVEDAKKVLDDAKFQAEKIINDAKEEAKKIIDTATEEAKKQIPEVKKEEAKVK